MEMTSPHHRHPLGAPMRCLRTTQLQEMTRMNAPQRTTTTPPEPRPSEEPAREREDARKRRLERERIGAAQLAAPSTRRWRRAGTFSSTDS
jgi:hypothetical protein